MAIDVKICGLKTPEAITAAVEGGAAYLGFVFFERSPRNVTLDEAAALMGCVPEGVKKVALVVDPDDRLLDSILKACPVDVIQLHGRETASRVGEVRARTGKPVMKALPIAGPHDIGAARGYEAAADLLLFDAKPPEGATRPGGNALSFDWELLAGSTWGRPWFLAGGLDAGNVVEAVRTSGAKAVDVSSGVEDAPGVKSIDKIKAFLRAVEGL